MNEPLENKYLGKAPTPSRSERELLRLQARYGAGIFDELSAIREAYVMSPERAAELAGCAVRTWNHWCKTDSMPRERFIAWVRALEVDWLARNPGAPTSGELWRVDQQGRVRRRANPTSDT